MEETLMYDLDIPINKPITIFWFRRDLRLNDNVALYYALKNQENVLPIFIFDEIILKNINLSSDLRIAFIEKQLKKINSELKKVNSSLFIAYGNPLQVFTNLIKEFNIQTVYFNLDFEPYSIERDEKVLQLLKNQQIKSYSYLDHLIFHPTDVFKPNGEPYTVFTPYKNKWQLKFKNLNIEKHNVEKYLNNFIKTNPFIFNYQSKLDGKILNQVLLKPTINLQIIENYHSTRNFPSLNGTSRLSVHLRFGTISIRELMNIAAKNNEVFMNELIWREFFIMILYYFKENVHKSFKPAYDNIEWINNEDQFKLWTLGKTGFPIVDAGMRELNETGYMHNRVRMIVASFLCKHLLIDWRWGEAYFADKLIDYELAVNNGNWQWAAGTGCDAAPYFRIFNPTEQAKKFDSKSEYICRWVKDYNTNDYIMPIVNHEFARKRCLDTYKKALSR